MMNLKKMMTTTARSANPMEILKQPYARRLTPDEDGGYVATIQEFAGCIAEGDTADEAVKNLEAAAESWIEARLEQNQPIPDPVLLYGYSGKIALRIPRGIHKQIAELAMAEGTSINQLILTAVSSYVGANGVVANACKQLSYRIQQTQVLRALPANAPVTMGTASIFRMPAGSASFPVVDSVKVMYLEGHKNG